jgi:uncharacterized membrane protein
METVILGIAGVILSLVFSYLPSARVWLEGFENKGIIMLGLVVVVAGGYFALACSPFAADLNIVLQCSRVGFFEVLKAVFVIASGNQLAFLYTRTNKS